MKNCLVVCFSMILTFSSLKYLANWGVGMGQRRAGAGLRVLELGGHREAAVSHEPGLMVPASPGSFFFCFSPATTAILELCSGHLALQVASTDEFSKQF